jgi:hypothetical protein
MSEVCFSGPALAVLTAVWAVISVSITTIFWLYVRAQQAALVRAQTKEDEATEDLRRALETGTTIAAAVDGGIVPRGRKR